MRVVSLILGIVCLGFAFSVSAKPVFMGLGDLPGGKYESGARGVSADGTVVVGLSGSASSGNHSWEAFRWTESSGMVGLGDLPGWDGLWGSADVAGFVSLATGVSADGSIVVGGSSSALGDEAFRWTQGGGMVGLGDLPGGKFSSFAYAISADGAVVVGYSESALGHHEAFRRFSTEIFFGGNWYTLIVMAGLGDLPGGVFSSKARAVSADGAIVVGRSNSASGWEAFRWTQSLGMVGLGDLPGGEFYSKSHAVSADGSVVVGYSHSASGGEAFHWSQGSGMVGLGDLPGGNFFSEAYAVSADGSVVVGFGKSASGQEAFIWDSTNGMREVDEVLTALGADLTGWTLRTATGISADGLTLVGYGTNPDGFTEGWIANLSCYNGGGDDSDSIPECPGDKDGDSVADRSDNCTEDANPEQVDSDADGYGNLCDADYDGDGVVSGRDFLLFRSTFGKRASQRGFLAAADADGDGVIAGADFLAFRAQYQRGAPGP